MTEEELLGEAAGLWGLTEARWFLDARLGLAVGHGHASTLARILGVKHRIVCQSQ
jgi:hypothetical protein